MSLPVCAWPGCKESNGGRLEDGRLLRDPYCCGDHLRNHLSEAELLVASYAHDVPDAKESAEERRAWDRYVAAVLPQRAPMEAAVITAGTFADLMLAERRKRFGEKK